MSTNIPLNDLIEALAGAVIDAQDRIEQHQVSNLLGYFDEQLRPKSLMVRLPSIHPQAEEGSEDLYRAPILPLVSTNLLKIKDVEVNFDVDLGEMKDKDINKTSSGNEQKEGESKKKDIFIDMAGGRLKNKTGSIHVVLRVESMEPTEGASRLINQLAQTQGIYKTVKVE
jgi:hypothetical protein